ncbi:MAG: response regulator [Proteobacteria bacterium]|nr:response regulator [Pseudomonadota bacterium]
MKLRVLFVDDNKLFLESIRRSLLDKQDEWDMSFVSDTTQALDILANGTDTVVVLDWMMPEVDGLTLAKTAKNIANRGDGPLLYFILLTAKQNTSDTVLALESGIDDYLCKPFDTRELKARIRVGQRLLQSERTTRTHAKEALGHSEERFRELVELLPEIVYETNEKGTVTFINKKSFETMGYSPDDLKKGLKFIDMVAPGERDTTAELVNEMMNGQRAGVIESVMQRKDGSTFSVINHSTTIIRKDKAIGLRGIILDITDRKQAEELFKRAKDQTDETNRRLEQAFELANQVAVQAEASSEAKSMFLANMSSKIDTPMTSVIDKIALLLDTELNEDQREHAEIISESATSLLDLVNNIINFSKNDTNNPYYSNKLD